MMKRLVAGLLVGMLFSSLAFAGSVAEAINVDGAYARAVPPGLKNSAAFMILSNPDEVEHKLVDARSDVSEVVELHTHINDDGMMRMRRVDSIAVPAGGITRLQPGGLHVMLIGLKKQLAPGDEVDLTLVFEDGSEIQRSLPVKKVMAPAMKCGHGKCGGGKCGGGK